MAEYIVEYRVRGTQTVIVEADSAAEAKRKVADRTADRVDVEFTVDSCSLPHLARRIE